VLPAQCSQKDIHENIHRNIDVFSIDRLWLKSSFKAIESGRE